MAPLLDHDAGTRLMGRTGTCLLTVTDVDTATALGSGDLPVFATPRMIALMEQAACAAIADRLPPGVTTVGVRVDVRHTRASAVGAVVTATATVTSVEGSRIGFEVSAIQAHDGESIEIGVGTHLRVAVDASSFVARLDAER